MGKIQPQIKHGLNTDWETMLMECFFNNGKSRWCGNVVGRLVVSHIFRRVGLAACRRVLFCGVSDGNFTTKDAKEFHEGHKKGLL